jgi:hypothetical protein
MVLVDGGDEEGQEGRTFGFGRKHQRVASRAGRVKWFCLILEAETSEKELLRTSAGQISAFPDWAEMHMATGKQSHLDNSAWHYLPAF